MRERLGASEAEVERIDDEAHATVAAAASFNGKAARSKKQQRRLIGKGSGGGVGGCKESYGAVGWAGLLR